MDRSSAVLTRYGLTEPKALASEERAWEARFRLRPEERARLEQLCRSYVAHLRAAAPRPK